MLSHVFNHMTRKRSPEKVAMQDNVIVQRSHPRFPRIFLQDRGRHCSQLNWHLPPLWAFGLGIQGKKKKKKNHTEGRKRETRGRVKVHARFSPIVAPCVRLTPCCIPPERTDWETKYIFALTAQDNLFFCGESRNRAKKTCAFYARTHKSAEREKKKLSQHVAFTCPQSEAGLGGKMHGATANGDC